MGTLPESLVCTTQFFTELTVSVRLNKLNSTYIIILISVFTRK